MIAAASSGGFINFSDYSAAIFLIIGLCVFVLAVLASRPLSRIAANQLQTRYVRPETIVVVRRVVTFIVIGIGLIAALAFALESANVALFGLVLATIVAALGVQDLLRDYVSGYYLLFERHLRVGDHIRFNGYSGTISEVRLRVTLIRNDEGDVVIVPNSELFNKPVTINNTTPEDEAKKAPPA